MSTEEEREETRAPETWGQRHAVNILTVVMFSLLALVMIIQMAC